MATTTIGNKDIITCLVNLIHDPCVSDYLDQPVNLFDIFEFTSTNEDNKKSSYETDYSLMWRWLLNPDETHGLGSLWIDRVMAVVGFDAITPNDEVKVSTEVAFTDSDEHGKYRGRIDLLILIQRASGSKQVVAIENKMGSDESETQLERYYTYITTNPAYRGWEPGFVFLTGNGDDAQQGTHASEWKSMKYDDLIKKDDAGKATRHPEKIIADFYYDQKRTFDKELDDALQEAIPDGKDMSQKIADLTENMGVSTMGTVGTITDSDRQEIIDGVAAAYHETPEAAETTVRALLRLIAQINKSGAQDHTQNPDVQQLIIKIAEQLTGKRLAPKETEKVTDDRFLKAGIVEVRRTQGKGQGLNLRTSDEKDTPLFYISGDRRGVVPYGGFLHASSNQEPNCPICASCKKFPKNKDVSYWNDHFDELIDTMYRAITCTL